MNNTDNKKIDYININNNNKNNENIMITNIIVKKDKILILKSVLVGLIYFLIKNMFKITTWI